MAFPNHLYPTSGDIEMKEDKVIGLKLDVSPDILPRDTSIGTKIFMLVPNEARNVREVKSYIANFVLRTPVPFQIFMNEYRIRDEEDAKIFSIINEPCRLIPVPLPRSALSSTPKPKSGDKRVTFFDGDLSASPVQGSVTNFLDVTDHSTKGRSIHSPHEAVGVTSTASTDLRLKSEAQYDDDEDLSDSAIERKKRRRRRHRSRKSKHNSEKRIGDLNENAVNGSESNGAEKSPDASQGNQEPESSLNTVRKSQLYAVNEETESEEETTGGSSKEFDFITPVTNNKVSRKRVDISETQGAGASKKKKLSDSAFDSMSSFTSPSSDTLPNKPRQDTPIVSRSVRYSSVESARKVIDVFSAEPSNEKNGLENAKSSNVISNNEDFYDPLQSIDHIDCVDIGDHIAFKVLELDERYNPKFSAYKEGIVARKSGTKLQITYTKNNVVVRTGKYELAEGEDEPDSAVDLHFTELIEPKLVSKFSESEPKEKAVASVDVHENESDQPDREIMPTE